MKRINNVELCKLLEIINVELPNKFFFDIDFICKRDLLALKASETAVSFNILIVSNHLNIL